MSLTLLTHPPQQVSASGLSSVVRFPSVEQWKTIDNGEPLAVFHAKFWGKSMAVEEKEWLNTQPPVADIGSEFEERDPDEEGKRMDSDETWGDLTYNILGRRYHSGLLHARYRHRRFPVPKDLDSR